MNEDEKFLLMYIDEENQKLRRMLQSQIIYLFKVSFLKKINKNENQKNKYGHVSTKCSFMIFIGPVQKANNI